MKRTFLIPWSFIRPHDATKRPRDGYLDLLTGRFSRFYNKIFNSSLSDHSTVIRTVAPQKSKAPGVDSNT